MADTDNQLDPFTAITAVEWGGGSVQFDDVSAIYASALNASDYSKFTLSMWFKPLSTADELSASGGFNLLEFGPLEPHQQIRSYVQGFISPSGVNIILNIVGILGGASGTNSEDPKLFDPPVTSQVTGATGLFNVASATVPLSAVAGRWNHLLVSVDLGARIQYTQVIDNFIPDIGYFSSPTYHFYLNNADISGTQNPAYSAAYGTSDAGLDTVAERYDVIPNATVSGLGSVDTWKGGVSGDPLAIPAVDPVAAGDAALAVGETQIWFGQALTASALPLLIQTKNGVMRPAQKNSDTKVVSLAAASFGMPALYLKGKPHSFLKDKGTATAVFTDVGTGAQLYKESPSRKN